ncbi:MAG: PAS domain-containing sensor histidine kinase, partial [Bacteroidetes bacterium]|nr:PAS domain-containing sensor histidine kinase [Bacteroidota bacterium]
NEIVHFKRKRTKEFHAKNMERWFNVHMLIPEYNKYYLIFEDTTKIKKQIDELEDSKRRYKVLLEAIPDIFFVIDKDGTYEDFVVKESHLFKIEDANIIGSTIFDVGFPDKMANKIHGCIHSSLQNNSIEIIEYSLNTPNGTFLYEMRLAKLSSTSVISVARDITKRKTAEFNLEKALAKAEESDRLKSAFLANLSHEIRTPMNVITNFSRILAETELDRDDRTEITDAIAENGKQLLNMIDNTIHLSKIETQSVDINMKFCNVNGLLRDIYNQFYPHIPDSKNIKLNLKLNVHNKEFGFVTDHRLLGEALAILVDNAVKYTLQGNVTIHYEMIKNENVRFIVSDTGIGIPEDEFEHVFNRFYRLNNNINETTSGSGLGLSIAQHYVEILGGKLEFESAQHVGTKFHFTLPFNEGKGFMMLVS